MVDPEAPKPNTAQSILLSESEPQIVLNVKDPLYIIQ
jgi:hypothetical protein